MAQGNGSFSEQWEQEHGWGEAGRPGAGGTGCACAGAAGHTGQAFCKQDMGHGLGSAQL